MLESVSLSAPVFGAGVRRAGSTSAPGAAFAFGARIVEPEVITEPDFPAMPVPAAKTEPEISVSVKRQTADRAKCMEIKPLYWGQAGVMTGILKFTAGRLKNRSSSRKESA